MSDKELSSSHEAKTGTPESLTDFGKRIMLRADFIQKILESGDIFTGTEAYEKMISEIDKKAKDTGLSKRDQLMLNGLKQMLERRFSGLVAIVEVDPGDMTDLEKTIRPLPLLGVLSRLESAGGLGVDDEIMFETVIEEKVVALAEKLTNPEEKKAFIDLCITLGYLFECGIMGSKTVDATHLTITNLEANIAAYGVRKTKFKALETNIAFNANFFVSSGGKNKDGKMWQVDSEQYHPNMGIIQTICCVAYQYMRDINNDFSKGHAYSVGEAEELINFICSQDSIEVVDQKGNRRTVFVKSVLDGYPPEIADVIKYIATLKASRDDLGNKASNYIMAHNGNSPKIENGAGAEDTGYIARSIYKSAQSADNREHMIFWAYVDPRKIKTKPLQFDSSGAASSSDIRAQEVALKQAKIDNYYTFRRKNWGAIVPRFRAQLTEWDQDFPGLDVFANGSNGIAAKDYDKARLAFRQIIKTAYESPGIKISYEYEAMKKQIESILSPLFTEIAKYFAYLGKPSTKAKTPGDIEFNYDRYHAIPMAAVSFALINLLMNVPADFVSSAKNLEFLFFTGFSDNHNKESERVYNDAVQIILNQLSKYPSIAGVYRDHFVELVKLDYLKDEFIEPTSRSNLYHRRRIEMDPALRILKGNQRDNEYRQPVMMPFEPAKAEK